jgi:hypothetical protein
MKVSEKQKKASSVNLTTPAVVTLNHVRSILCKIIRSEKNPEAAMQAAEMLGRLNWYNNDGRLSDELLEVELTELYGPRIEKSAPASSEAVGWMHIISEGNDFGGHTPLMLNIVEGLASRNAHQTVAVTRTLSEIYINRLRALGVNARILRGTIIERASEVFSLGLNADCIVLYIHPDDAGVAIAARLLRARGKKVLFVNHADHAFSFGSGAADVVLELSGIGWNLTSKYRAANSQSFLGIPIQQSLPAPIRASSTLARLNGPIISMGASYKYRPFKELSFPDFLIKFLTQTDKNFDLIGPSGREPWWSEVKLRYPDRVRFLGQLPQSEVRARLAEAVAYVDSFPMAGGTAFSQALLNGCTVFKPSKNAGGYSLADFLCSSTIDEMTRELLDFIEHQKQPLRQKKIREQILEKFSSAAVTDRLISAANGCYVPIIPDMAKITQELDYYVRIWNEERLLTFRLNQADRIYLFDRLKIANRFIFRSKEGLNPGRRVRISRLIRWVAMGTV